MWIQIKRQQLAALPVTWARTCGLPDANSSPPTASSVWLFLQVFRIIDALTLIVGKHLLPLLAVVSSIAFMLTRP